MEKTCTVTKDDLVALGFKTGTAYGIIRKAKHLMINKGFSFYQNKRISCVPRKAVEEILGMEIEVHRDKN